MKRKLAWLMICVMMIASIPFTAAAETVETVSDNIAAEAVAEVVEVTEAVVGEISDATEEENSFVQQDENHLLFENGGQRIIVNSGNQSGEFIQNEKYVKGAETDSNGKIYVNYFIEKQNVENDIQTENGMKDSAGMMNIWTKVKAPASASTYQLSQRPSDKGQNVAEGGYVYLAITVYDAREGQNHFANDSLTGKIIWLDGSNTEISREDLKICWTESWRFALSENNERINEATIVPGEQKMFHLDINNSVVKEEPKKIRIFLENPSSQNIPAELVGDSSRDWRDENRNIVIKGLSEGDVGLRVIADTDDDSQYDLGQASIRVHVRNDSIVHPNSGNQSGNFKQDRMYVQGAETDTNGRLYVNYFIDKHNVENDVANVKMESDRMKVWTTVKAPAGATEYRLSNWPNDRTDGISSGQAYFDITVYDEGHFTEDKIIDTLIWLDNNGQKKGEDNLEICWSESWGFAFTEKGKRVSEIVIAPGETITLQIIKNDAVVSRDAVPDTATLSLENVNGNNPFTYSGDQTQAWNNEITITAGSTEGSADLAAVIHPQNNPGGDMGRARIHISVQSGGGEDETPYKGEIRWSYTPNDLHFELEGWTKELQQEYGDPFTKTLIGSGRDAYWSIELDLSDDAWRAVYNNADLTDGISLSMYPDVPGNNSIIKYMCASNEVYPEDQLENHLRTIMNHNPMEFQDGTRELKHKVGYPVAEVVSVGGRRVLNLKESSGVDEHYIAWYTRLNPKETYFYPDQANVHIAKFTFSQKGGERSLYVDEGSKLKTSWLTFDTEGTFSNAELKSATLSDRIVRYVLDGDALGLDGYSRYTLDNNHQAYYTTKLSIPDVDPGSVTVTCMGKYTDGIVDAGDPGNILFKTPFAAVDRFLADRDYVYKVVYSIGGVSYTEYLTFRTTIEYKDCLLRYYGYEPVPKNRVFFNSTLTDAQRNGFDVEYISDGQIATKWKSNYLNTAGMKGDFYVQAPKPEVKAYKIFRHTSYSGMNPRKVVDINMEGAEWVEYKDRAETVYGWLPTPHTVSGYPFYSLNQPITDDQEWYVINWLCNDNSIIREYLYVAPDREYPYDSADKHTKIIVPEEVHNAGGDPEPRLYAIYDSKGVERKDTGYFLKVEYFGKDASYANGDYDYYRITLVDPFGEPADLQQGWVELIFSYPNGKTKTEMENMNFVLAHYQDEMHESSAKEKLSFEEDGIHVTLDHFSPFLLTWTETEAPALTGLEIAEAPKKTVYTAGESFDQTGMEILAVYSDGQRKTVTGYTVKPSGKLTVGDTYVEISYTENGVTKTVTQKITVRAASSPTPVYADTDRSDTSESPLYTGTWNAPVKNGTWSQDKNGIWHYTSSEIFRNTWGYIVNPYAKEGQHTADWFWFDRQGNMLTGWQFINGKWYYLNPTKDGTLGACQLGGVTPDGWTVDANGAWIESIPQKKV